MMDVTLDRPWLEARFDEPLTALSWAPFRPGFVTADRVLWREVRNADLTEEFDVITWLAEEVVAKDGDRAVAMLTSRNVSRYRLETAVQGRAEARCLATVGLSNAERVGHREAAKTTVNWGTVNLLVTLSEGLTRPSMIEAISIATQARTAAILDHGPRCETGPATGTGTDCIVLAAPEGGAAYVGLHTDIGEVIGRAVYQAVAEGTKDWMQEEAGR